MFKHYWFIAALGGICPFLLIGSFMEIGSPISARAIALDQQRISHMSDISYEVQTYYEDNGKLPTSLSQVTSLAEKMLKDPGTNKQYEYKVASQTSYDLCTEFSTDSKEVTAKLKKNPDYYDDYSRKVHKKGNDCINYKVTGNNDTYDISPTPIVTPAVSMIKEITPNIKWHSEDQQADIVVDKAYWTESKVITGDQNKNILLVEFSVTNTAKNNRYYYGNSLGELKYKNSFISSNSGNEIQLGPNETGKLFAAYVVDPNILIFDLTVGDLENSPTTPLDFTKATTVSGVLSVDKGLTQDQ